MENEDKIREIIGEHLKRMVNECQEYGETSCSSCSYALVIITSYLSSIVDYPPDLLGLIASSISEGSRVAKNMEENEKSR